MYGVLPGVPTVKQLSAISAGAGYTYVDLKPPRGEVWLVQGAKLWHDDDHAARTVAWWYNDGVTNTELWAETNVASGVHKQLYDVVKVPVPWTCNQIAYLRASAYDVVATDHRCYLYAVVHVLRGVELWRNT